MNQKKEYAVLRFSFIIGLIFALAEFIFAVFSHSQSVLMDATYDSAELIFVALILLLNPLFYKPISEKRPFGFYQAEAICVSIKGFMMIAVTVALAVNVIGIIINGGNPVDSKQIVLFQLVLGVISIAMGIFLRAANKKITGPSVKAEVISWKQDALYSGGMAVAFGISVLLEKTRLAEYSPYFDPAISLIIACITIPELIKITLKTTKDIFLFAPDKHIVEEIKTIGNQILGQFQFKPIFYDITRTGRFLWISIYFQIEKDVLCMEILQEADALMQKELAERFENYNCELIVTNKENI
ncbi:MAG: cation transporter [Spirochaetales bacterium]